MSLRDGFTEISSDHLSGAKYNSRAQKMILRYKNGYHYEVSGVSPETYQEFMDAPSQGIHFHQYIKGNYHIERVK
jgi:hypothetical protein